MTVTFFVTSFRRRPDIRVSLTSLQCRALFVTWNWNQDNKMYFFVTLSVTKDPEGRAKRESGDTASNGIEVSAPRTAHWRLEQWVGALYSRATVVPSTLPWSWGFSRVFGCARSPIVEEVGLVLGVSRSTERLCTLVLKREEPLAGLARHETHCFPTKLKALWSQEKSDRGRHRFFFENCIFNSIRKGVL